MVDDQMATPQETLGSDDLRGLCGDLLDWKVEAILALNPTAADVATAVGWAGGQDELGQEGRPLAGVAAQVYDLLLSDDPVEEER